MSGSPVSIRRPLALILEDDIPQAKLLAYVLNKFGIDSEFYASSIPFLTRLSEIKPDIAFIDLNVDSDKSGLDMIQSIRRNPALQTVIIVTSQVSDRASITQALDLGANDFIVKPIDRTILALKTSRWIKTQELLDLQGPLLPIPRGGSPARLCIPFEIESIFESGMTLTGQQRLPLGYSFQIESPLFLGPLQELKYLAMRIVSCTRTESSQSIADRYQIETKFEANHPEFLRSIRRFLLEKSGIAAPPERQHTDSMRSILGRSISGPKTVLLHGLSSYQQSLTRKLLEASGYQVSASDSNSQLEEALNLAPHLILIEISPTNSSGFQFLEARMKNSILSQIPVIALASQSNFSLLRRALSLQVTDCLVSKQENFYTREILDSRLLLEKISKAIRNLKRLALSMREGPFEDQHPANSLTIMIPAKLFSGSEVGFFLQLPFYLSPGVQLKIQSEFLADLNCPESVMVKTDTPARPTSDGQYLNEVAIIGISPNAVSQIRRLSSFHS